MDEKEIENIDLPNDEELELELDGGEDDKDAKIASLEKKNQSLYEQAKKAKGFVRDTEGKWIKKEVKVEEKEEKSSGLDYGQKAFLVANGIKGEAETKLVEDVMKDTGKSLEQVLDSKYFQAELEERRELAKTSNAIPTGKRSGNMATDSVEYWMTKPMEEVPQEMRIKVVNAKLKQSENKGVFYNS